MNVATRGFRLSRVQFREEAARRFDFAPWTELPPIPMVVNGRAEGATQRVSLFERLVALGMLLIISPLMLLIALVIKCHSPGGPVLYQQERVGLDRRRSARGGNGRNGGEGRKRQGIGQPFLIFKFRTMVPDAEQATGPVWAKERDPRVTRVGRILRKLHLDELPQLINVIRGQMRLIGPRPERPQFVERLCLEIPEYQRRQRVLPGITGLAQVERQYDASVDDVRRKVRYDVFYAENRSMLMDVKILLKTIDVALRGRGAL